MRGISSLVLLGITLALGQPAWAQSQSGSFSVFTNYQEAKNKVISGTELQSDYWDQQFKKQNEMKKAIAKDIGDIFMKYLDGNLFSADMIQAELQKNQISNIDFAIESSFAIPMESIRLLKEKMPNLRLVQEIELSRSSNELIPIHFRVYDDEVSEGLSTYYERGTHKIKMSLDLVERENWFTWFAHEYLHYFDPQLRVAETAAEESSRLAIISKWVQTNHEVLTNAEEKLLNSYFSDLTDLSIKAEWRDWVATSLLAEKMFRAGLIHELPPCLGFLDELHFGIKPLEHEELKTIWWLKLKEGFYVDPAGLFTSSWLKKKLVDYVNNIDVHQLQDDVLIGLIDDKK